MRWCRLAADINQDGAINLADLAALSAYWLSLLPDPNAFAYIPAGVFHMGDHLAEGAAYEQPVHTVYLDSYYMGRYEVTNQQYCDYLNSALSQGLIEVNSGIVYVAGGTDPYCDTHTYSNYSQIDYAGGVFTVRTKAARDMSNDPMVQVSWIGAVAYCDFYGCRLPTEAQWEYAARGGFNSPCYRFPWGDGISHSQANFYADDVAPVPYYDISPTRQYHPAYSDDIHPYTAPVGSFSPNGYGLYDMAGNIWEWCSDWFSETYYQECFDAGTASNPTGPAATTKHVLRGGGWHGDPEYCRVAARVKDTPDYRYAGHGFRVVLDVE